MNAVEIDQEIVRRMAEVKYADELEDLKKWAKAAKRAANTSPSMVFIRMNYSFETIQRGGSGSKARHHRVHNIQYTSVRILGVEVKLPEPSPNNWHKFPESNFYEKRLWVDSRIKWGGWEFSPKQPITHLGELDIMEAWRNWMIEKKFFLVDLGRRFVLSNNNHDALKATRYGWRPTQRFLCGDLCIPIAKKDAPIFLEFLPLKTHEELQ
jgi:hypothetical protein